MNKRPTFKESATSFVILAWNSQSYLKDCLESVLAIKCSKMEVYVIDNGSSDATPTILSEIAKSNEHLHVITESENLGTTVSRNKALSKISNECDYVCVLDSDTVVNQTAFESLADALADESIGVVGPTMINNAGEEQLSGRNFPTVGIKFGKAIGKTKSAEAEVPTSEIKNGLQDVDYLLSACWLIPNEVLARVGMLDEKIFYAPEDVDWCMRCHKAGFRVVRDHTAQIIHDYQRLSRQKLFSKINWEHMKGLAHYFKKHGYLLNAPKFE